MLAPALRDTLVETIAALREARDPWWIIASAAVALHGAGPIHVGDVDVLLSLRDAGGVLDRIGLAPVAEGATPLFRSAVFARWTAPPLTVEFMAGFHVATDRGWMPILPQSRVPVDVGGGVAYVPDRRELAAMLRLFGRPKDLARAQMLEAARRAADPDSFPASAEDA